MRNCLAGGSGGLGLLMAQWLAASGAVREVSRHCSRLPTPLTQNRDDKYYVVLCTAQTSLGYQPQSTTHCLLRGMSRRGACAPAAECYPFISTSATGLTVVGAVTNSMLSMLATTMETALLTAHCCVRFV
jgi:hypothetical protein